MLVFSLLILSVGAATVSARSIGLYMSNLHIRSPLATSTTSHLETSPPVDITSPQCLFSPHQPFQKTQSPASIPPHAWPHIRTLLASHSNLIHPPSKSSVQTLRLADMTNDSSLESVVLGIVYTVPERTPGQKELRGLLAGEGLGVEKGAATVEERCLESAMRDVEMRRQMEGVLEMEGKGKVGFLVYRVD